MKLNQSKQGNITEGIIFASVILGSILVIMTINIEDALLGLTLTILSTFLLQICLEILPKLFVKILTGLIAGLGKTRERNLFKARRVNLPICYILLNIAKFFYSDKTQKEIFEVTCADWQKEYFEALFKKEIWKARWINVRYTYAFLAAMWQKSPIGDLIEFVVKIAKQ